MGALVLSMTKKDGPVLLFNPGRHSVQAVCGGGRGAGSVGRVIVADISARPGPESEPNEHVPLLVLYHCPASSSTLSSSTPPFCHLLDIFRLLPQLCTVDYPVWVSSIVSEPFQMFVQVQRRAAL